MLLAAEPSGPFAATKLTDRAVQYVNDDKPRPLKAFGVKIANGISGSLNQAHYQRRLLRTNKSRAFVREIERQRADVIIAVDSFSLWCAQQAGCRAHLLSFEIREPDPYFAECDLSLIDSVIIQSQERYDYLFNGRIRPPVSIMPNAPPFLAFTPEYDKRNKNNLIYCGTAAAEFGVFNAIEFIGDYPEYTLTLKGAIPDATREGIDKFYSSLLAENRLIICNEYSDADSLTRFISTFWAGLAFYDFYRFPFYRSFNYNTAPSGKLYQYFNAGVPVVANRLSGFRIVEEAKAGQLVPYLSSVQIERALKAIEADYSEMAVNAKRLSKRFDVVPFVDAFIHEHLDRDERTNGSRNARQASCDNQTH